MKNQQMHDEIFGEGGLLTQLALKVDEEMSDKGLKLWDLSMQLYRPLGFGVPVSARDYISALRHRLITNRFPRTEAESDSESGRIGLRRISVVLSALGLKEEDPVIKRLKRIYGYFPYPLAEVESTSVSDVHEVFTAPIFDSASDRPIVAYVFGISRSQRNLMKFLYDCERGEQIFEEIGSPKNLLLQDYANSVAAIAQKAAEYFNKKGHNYQIDMKDAIRRACRVLD